MISHHGDLWEADLDPETGRRARRMGSFVPRAGLVWACVIPERHRGNERAHATRQPATVPPRTRDGRQFRASACGKVLAPRSIVRLRSVPVKPKGT